MRNRNRRNEENDNDGKKRNEAHLHFITDPSSLWNKMASPGFNPDFQLKKRHIILYTSFFPFFKMTLNFIFVGFGAAVIW